MLFFYLFILIFNSDNNSDNNVEWWELYDKKHEMVIIN